MYIILLSLFIIGYLYYFLMIIYSVVYIVSKVINSKSLYIIYYFLTYLYCSLSLLFFIGI